MGLLDFANTDDGMQGLGLLAAAAPQMAPMNLAGRLAQAAQGYQGMKENYLKQQETAQQLQMKNIALQQQQQEWAMQMPLLKMMSDRLQGNAAPQAPNAPQQSDPTIPYSAAPRDMLSDDPIPRSQPTQQPQQPQQAQQGGSMFPGIPDSVAFPTAAFAGMKALVPLMGKYNEPTPMQKDNAYMGISPQESAIAQRRKMGAEGMINARSGSTVLDGLTHQPIFTAPNEKNQSMLTWDGGVPTAVPIRGGQAVIRDAAKAETAGAGDALPVTAYDAQGKPVFTNRTTAAMGGASSNAAGDGRYPSQGGTSGPLSPTLSPASQAAGVQAGEGAGKQYVADNASANGYSTRKYNLQQALSNLQNADVGPGAKTANNFKSFLLSQTPFQLGQYLPGVDLEKIKSYDEANKYLTQYAMNKAGALGEGTDAKLATTLSGNASTGISKLAATDVVKANLGLEDMQNAQIKAFNKSGQPPENYQKFATQWNAGVDPRVFVWDYATPANKTKIAQDMNADQRAKFFQQYNSALKSGYISGPQK